MKYSISYKDSKKKISKKSIAFMLGLVMLTGISPVEAKPKPQPSPIAVEKPKQQLTVYPLVQEEKPVVMETGVASYYDYVLKDGWSSKGHFVCASRTFARKSVVKVTNIKTGRSVQCTITDYGPDKKVHPERVIDMSSTAFSQIESTNRGLIGRVKVELVKGN